MDEIIDKECLERVIMYVKETAGYIIIYYDIYEYSITHKSMCREKTNASVDQYMIFPRLAGIKFGLLIHIGYSIKYSLLTRVEALLSSHGLLSLISHIYKCNGSTHV